MLLVVQPVVVSMIYIYLRVSDSCKETMHSLSCFVYSALGVDLSYRAIFSQYYFSVPIDLGNALVVFIIYQSYVSLRQRYFFHCSSLGFAIAVGNSAATLWPSGRLAMTYMYGASSRLVKRISDF